MASLLRCVYLPKRWPAATLFRTQRVRTSGSTERAAAASKSTSASLEAYEHVEESDAMVETTRHDRRISALGIQMISKSLHEQIFGREPDVYRSKVGKSKQHLKAHDINTERHITEPLRDIDVDLPPLLGCDINEHFVTIAKQQTEPYLSLAKTLANATLPKMPKKWCFSAGWTKYDGNSPTAVPCPDEDALVFDVEVCVRDSERPVMATAVSSTHWYSWVSERLVSHEDYDMEVQGRTTQRNLIPLESDPDCSSEPLGGEWRERVVVGHNVSYDRARVKEQYLVKGPRTKFLDTMSLHVCVAGQTATQKLKWPKLNSTNGGGDGWESVSCPNGLADVHWLHVGSHKGSPRIDKEKRDVFVKGRIQDVRKQFQGLMKYCANDVLATHEVLSAVLPVFLQRCPHPVTLTGMLEMGGAYIPVNTSWEKYIADCEYKYEEMEGEMKAKLMALADNACTYIHGQRYLQSPWLCNLDWSSKRFRGRAKKKDMEKLLQQLEQHYRERDEEFRAGRTGVGGVEGEKGRGGEKEKEEGRRGEEGEGDNGGRVDFFISGEDGPAKRAVHMAGYPEWYRNLCMRRSAKQWCPGPVLVSAQMRVAPYLLRMKWKGFPLHHHGHLGWGYIVSPETQPGVVPEWDEEDNVGVQTVGLAEKSEQLLGDPASDEDDGGVCGIDVELAADDVYDSYIYHQLSGATPGRYSVADGRHASKSEERRGEGEGEGDEEGEGEGGEEMWVAERVHTPFGLTDDVVNLTNGKSYYFFKLPHKDGAECNVGNPLAKGFLHQMENGTLTSAAGHLGQRILVLNSMIASWRSARQRILEQFVVWNDDHNTAENNHSNHEGVILPKITVAGTVTRRAVEPTWLTASNAKETRVGSELKAMVRAPTGYHFVGADVDSQELWIASVLGDAHFAGMHGSTAIGWMTLQGNKADGTDVHSRTAANIGISRDQAKILNYGRIYGAGRPFIELLLKQFNPNLTEREVEEKAHTLLESTKGRRLYSSSKGRAKVWAGGSESDLFNKLEGIAQSAQPTTPALGCVISRALETKHTKSSYAFFPSKVNWVVQSSAVDYLHLMLVATKWLADTYDIDGRFCISIHDEVRYLVKSEDRYRFALALQYANLLTRSMFAHRLDLHDLPMSVAFFSAIDVDKCLRKEATMDCRTPSNPLGLEKGHNMPQGEALDIYEILARTGGSLRKAVIR